METKLALENFFIRRINFKNKLKLRSIKKYNKEIIKI